MKKHIFTVIGLILIALVACNSSVPGPVETNVAEFHICASEDLLEIADIVVQHSKTGETKSFKEEGSSGLLMTDRNFSFSYSGDNDEVGLKAVVALKEVYPLKKSYNLELTVESVLKLKGSDSPVSNTRKKILSIDDLKDENGVVIYHYYKLGGSTPVLSEVQPVDWSSDDPPVVIDAKRYGGCYCALVSEGSTERGTVSSNFLKRMKLAGESFSDNTKVFIVEGQKINELTDEQYSNIVKLAARDGKIVLLNTNKEQFKQFSDRFIVKAADTDRKLFSEEFKIFFDRFRNVGGEYVNFDTYDGDIGIIAICNSRLFIVDDDEPTNEGESQVNSAGSSLNYLIAWLNDDFKDDIKAAYERAKADANDMDLDSLESAQIVDASFTAVAYDNWRDRKVPVHVRYYIWTAHSLDNGHDFYIIEEEVQAENDKWYCKVQDSATWDKSTPTPMGHTGKNYGSYGPYMRLLTIDNQIDASGDKVAVSDYAPVNQSGSSTVMTGISFSLGGNIGLSGQGVAGGLSGAVGFNKSEVINIPELRVEVTQDGANLKTQFIGADINLHENPCHWWKHDLAKGERVSSMEVKNRWIWDIDNKNTAKTYKFTGKVSLQSECLDYHCKYSGLGYEYWWLRQSKNTKQTITLFAPSRFCENYLLQAETPDDWDYAKKQAFQDFMVEKFEHWYSNANVYSPKDDNLDNLAMEHFDEAVNTFEQNKNVIATAGYYGTFNFYIQKTVSGEILKSHELTVEKK